LIFFLKAIPRKFHLSEDHQKKRVAWTKEIKDSNFEEWLFSDETKFTTNTRKRKAFEFEGEDLADVKFAHPISQQVWACMSSKGIGAMEFIDGKMTGEVYKGILKKHLRKAADKLFDGNWKFQQDNDPKHTSKTVMNWLQEEKIELVPWPAGSPDMNVQENLHSTWKDRVDALHPTTNEDLRKKIKKVFYEITKEDTEPLVVSMKRRVEALQKAKGGHTKY
jgi:hypothetical protein